MIKHFCCSIFILLVVVSNSIAQNAYRLIDYDAEGTMYTITNGDADNFDPQKATLTKYSELGVKLKEQKFMQRLQLRMIIQEVLYSNVRKGCKTNSL